MARLPLQIQTGRPRPRTKMGSASSTTARLADVVRGTRQLSREPMARQFHAAPARRFARCAGTAGHKSVPFGSAPLHSSAALRLQIHQHGRAPRDRKLVAPRTERRLFPDSFTETAVNAF